MCARLIRVQGTVQGVGFRPFIYRLAQASGVRGWVLNAADGVRIHVEGPVSALDDFARQLTFRAPAAAVISNIEISDTGFAGFSDFVIRDSQSTTSPTVRISPDLPVCEDCLRELFDPADPRYRYPYINCTNCGPRFSVIESLPYDRSNTTMRHWPMDSLCANQYSDPLDRRFHAQPVACLRCGPHYMLENGETVAGKDHASIEQAAKILRDGGIIAVKGIGGYHLSCDAGNAHAVRALRERKFRKEKPFAVMVRSFETARQIVTLSSDAEELLRSPARPIVLAPARIQLTDVAPGNRELGVMLPYTPLHHLLFSAGAPEILLMTSANRSSEPIAYRDNEARQRLSSIADSILVGERPIARRVDDSVARAGVLGPVILRRSRGYAPGAVATFPIAKPILALGADLKNTITLVVDGQAFVSQHIGDLEHYEAFAAFKETIRDFIEMYRVNLSELTVVHDAHPQYASTQYALELPADRHFAVQHHRAHIASVLAERHAWERRAIGVCFDGTGYGDDGTIWGGEFFAGSIAEGWTRLLHLRNAALPGGDAAAKLPVQCAAGFLGQLDHLPNLMDPPFRFPHRYLLAQRLVKKAIRSFNTSSVGRLFDCVAALLGFTHEITYDGQAAIWLEQLARTDIETHREYPFPVHGLTLDFRPLLSAVIEDRLAGKEIALIAKAFHLSVARAVNVAVNQLSGMQGTNLVVLSGGVFQNELLLEHIIDRTRQNRLELWTNRAVPPNDGGISLGQSTILFQQQITAVPANTDKIASS